MSTAIKLRGDTTANWNINNPLLLEREIVVDTTLLRFKIGDGITLYNSLPYMDASLVTELGLKADSSDVTTALGTKAPIENPAFTGDITLGNVSTQTDTGRLNMVIPVGQNNSYEKVQALYYSGELDGDPIPQLLVGNSSLNPKLLGIPTAPTASSTTNTTQIATTEFVQDQKLQSVFNTNANTTFALSDANKLFICNTGSEEERDFIIPTNSSVAFPVGTIIKVYASQTNVNFTAPGVTVLNTISSATFTVPTKSYIELVKASINTWVVLGTVIATV